MVGDPDISGLDGKSLLFSITARKSCLFMAVTGTEQVEQPLGWAAEPALRNRSAYLPAVLPCTSIKTPDMLQNCRGNRLRNYRGLFLKSSRKKRTIFPRRYRNISHLMRKRASSLKKQPVFQRRSASCLPTSPSPVLFTYVRLSAPATTRPEICWLIRKNWISRKSMCFDK